MLEHVVVTRDVLEVPLSCFLGRQHIIKEEDIPEDEARDALVVCPVVQLYKIGLPQKLILRQYFQENRNSRRCFLVLRISFPGRPVFIQLVPVHIRYRVLQHLGPAIFLHRHDYLNQVDKHFTTFLFKIIGLIHILHMAHLLTKLVSPKTKMVEQPPRNLPPITFLGQLFATNMKRLR